MYFNRYITFGPCTENSQRRRKHRLHISVSEIMATCNYVLYFTPSKFFWVSGIWWKGFVVTHSRVAFLLSVSECCLETHRLSYLYILIC